MTAWKMKKLIGSTYGIMLTVLRGHLACVQGQCFVRGRKCRDPACHGACETEALLPSQHSESSTILEVEMDTLELGQRDDKGAHIERELEAAQ